MQHEARGDHRRDQVEDRHRQQPGQDHSSQKHAPFLPPSELGCSLRLEATQRYRLEIFTAEKITVQPVEYKKINNRNEIKRYHQQVQEQCNAEELEANQDRLGHRLVAWRA